MCEESRSLASGPTVECCSPFEVAMVSACPVASNCTIFPVATSVVCVFGFTGVLDEALVGWAVAWTGADGDGALDEAASADPAKDNVATATASERMVICMRD